MCVKLIPEDLNPDPCFRLQVTRDAIEDIKNELISMQSILVDADRKGAGSEGEKTWVANVRDMAYDVEDIIDEFFYRMNCQQIGGRSSWILHHTICFPKNLWVRRQTATKIQKINEKIKGAIPERNQRYGVDHIKGTSSKYDHKWLVQHAKSSLFFREDKLVRIEKKRQSLMGYLMDGEHHQSVISIAGMGGSGKTTLAANTYNNDDVKKHFNCCAWITISQAYDIEDLLRSMIKRFYKSMKEVDPTNLSSMNHMDYQLVLDDVWDTNLLDNVKVPLQDSCLGSRIILTTRKEDVACYPLGGKHHKHHIQLLQNEEPWELFCKKAFTNCPDGSCPLELKSFAEELVGKCEGLPLAIAALGSLMYFKNMSQWNEIKNNLKSILLLSFNDLPYQLKHCFLYCSLFANDYQIQRKRLIKLWMAEGFVEPIEGSTLEEVADSQGRSQNLELGGAALLLVARRCKMHDLLRELALSISFKEKFGSVHDGREEMKECKARRITIHKIDGELKSFTGMSKIRSFLVFNRMLNKLPLGIFKVFNLRYLNLRGSLLKKLPNSIGRLLKLQTLDLRDTQIEALPLGIGKLQNLRHLGIFRCTRNWNDFIFSVGIQAPSNIAQLKNLQAVCSIATNDDLIRQIWSMTQVTTLGISNVKAANEMDLFISIQNMTHLKNMSVKVFLTGNLEKVPQWFRSLQSLTFWYMHWSKLEEDLLPHIAALHHLERLSLTNAYVRKQLYFSTSFLKLTELWICNFLQLNEIIIEKGVMPNLKYLYIGSCMELKNVLMSIEYLKNLQQLNLESVLVELENRICNVDFLKVQHIPMIYI
ncbi:hypothetical protein ACB092_12G008800 [Castanea dentata]